MGLDLLLSIIQSHFAGEDLDAKFWRGRLLHVLDSRREGVREARGVPSTVLSALTNRAL